MRVGKIVSALTVLFTSLVFSGFARADATAGHPMIGKTAPEIELPTIAGEKLSLRSLQGTYVVIHFGTSW